MAEHLHELQLKTTATDKLTRPYLEKLNRQNYIATAITILIVIFSLFWELYKLGGQEKTIYFADSMYGVAAWIGSFWAWRTAYRARFGPLRLEPRHQLAWFVIGFALFANGIGGFITRILNGRDNLIQYPHLQISVSPFSISSPLLVYSSCPQPRNSEVSYSHWVGCHHYDALHSGNKLVFCDRSYFHDVERYSYTARGGLLSILGRTSHPCSFIADLPAH